MQCKCCGIRVRIEGDFCDDRCKERGVSDELHFNRKARSKYPYLAKCVKCGCKIMKYTNNQQHCFDCRLDRSHINKPK